jgi:tetratricopeptide (TPR) repeat protein
MNSLNRFLSQRRLRWAALGLGVVIVLGIGWAGWAVWKSRYEAQGAVAFAQARTLAAQSQATGAAPDASQRAEKALEAVIADYPRLSSVAQASYLLGSMRFASARYPEARASYEFALAALDIGYCWEAEKDYGAAEKAYQSLLNDLAPTNFLYEEVMVGLARVQELGGRRAAAVETYQRLLRDLPDTRRAEEIRSRLASSQPPAKP